MFHIVDDDSLMCTFIGTVVQDAGYDYEHFYSAAAYLKYMQTRSYEAPVALLTDYVMPSMNGCELADEVYKRTPDQTIVLISGQADMDDHRPEFEHFHAQFPKPFLANSLVSLLHDLLIHQLLQPAPALKVANQKVWA